MPIVHAEVEVSWREEPTKPVQPTHTVVHISVEVSEGRIYLIETLFFQTNAPVNSILSFVRNTWAKTKSETLAVDNKPRLAPWVQHKDGYDWYYSAYIDRFMQLRCLKVEIQKPEKS